MDKLQQLTFFGPPCISYTSRHALSDTF